MTDPNDPALTPSTGAIPPIDPNVNGNPDTTWAPPWLAQMQDAGVPSDPNQPSPGPGEIQMPDDFVGQPPASLPAPSTEQQFAPPWLAAAQGNAGQAPPPEADAVSGGPGPAEALNPQQTQDRFATIATNPTAPLDERSRAWAAMTPDQQTNVLNTTDPKQLAALANEAMTPQQLATIQVRHNAAKLDEETQRQQAIYAENDRRAKQEAAEQLAATQHAATESAKDAQAALALVAKAKTDPNQRGVFGILKDVILSGIGGAMSQYTGGKNLALESIQKRIEQNIAAQTQELNEGWKAIDLHKNSVAAEYARHGDVIRAQGVARLAGLQEAKDVLVTDMQNYDPQGTTALNRSQIIQQITGAQQTAANALHEQNFKNGMELAKTQSAAAAQQETERHNRAGEGLDWAKVSIEKDKATAAKAADQVMTPDEFKALGYTSIPTTPMSAKQWNGVLESNAKTSEAQGKATENAQKLSSGQVLNGSGKPFLDEKGNAVQVNPEVAKDLNKETAGGQAYLDEMGKVKRMLTADPSTFDREKWAELNSHLETAAASWTQLYGAKASSRELEAAKEVVGANFQGYTARVKDKGTGIAAIGAQIDSTKQNLNTQLKRRAGVQGGADLFDTSEPPPTKETPADKVDKTLTQNFGAADVDPSALSADDRAFAMAAQQGITKSPSFVVAKYAENNNLSTLATRALHENIAPAQLQAFDSLEADIVGRDDAARAAAVERLTKIAGGSKSAAVQDYAKDLIKQASATVLEGAAPATEAVTFPDQAVAHEVAPPMPKKTSK